jgi:arsenical pump membrane protein
VPPLGPWLARFALPSVLSVIVTFAMLRVTQRRALDGTCESELEPVPLTPGGRISLAGIATTALALMTVSALDMQLGLPTALLGVLTTLAVMLAERRSPWPVVKEISWDVLPLVAGLFVLVAMLEHTGVIDILARTLAAATRSGETATGLIAGAALAVACNLVNNLPAGLVASSTLLQAHSPERIVDALLIGVDLGPNLSVTGSLATILWLNAIRREGENVGFRDFLKVGGVVMLPAVACALAARIFFG